MKTLKYFLIFLLLLGISGQNSYSYFYWTCGSTKVKWNSNTVRFRLSRVSFPENQPYTVALMKTIGKWNFNPSNFAFLLTPNDSSVELDNGQNEAWFSSGSSLGGAKAVTFMEMDCDDLLHEADVVFNVDLQWTQSNYKRYLIPYGGNHLPFEAIATHEFGHALGLDHEYRTYTCMFSWAHFHTNGTYAIPYPGEDACDGAAFLYGLNSSRPQDLAVSNWRLIAIGSGPLDHNRTVMYDHEPPVGDESWAEMAEMVGGPSGWIDNIADPRFWVKNGETIWPEFTFENNGPSSQTVKVGYYISTDDNITTSDNKFWESNFTLNRGWVYTKPLQVTLPTNLNEDTEYYIGVIVDDDDAINEILNEGNNATYLGIKTGYCYPVSITFNPNYVEGGESTIGKINLVGASSPSGMVVILSSTDPFITFPSSVTIPAGARSKTFIVSTSQIPGDGYHRARISVIRDQIGGGGSGEFYIRMHSEYHPDETLCEVHPDFDLCVMCENNPDLPICATLMGTGGDEEYYVPIDEFYAPESFSGSEFPFSRNQEKPQMPAFLFNLYNEMSPLLNFRTYSNASSRLSEQLVQLLDEVPTGLYFTEKKQKSITNELKTSDRINPMVLNNLVEALNAIELDVNVPPIPSVNVEKGKLIEIDFQGVAWASFMNVKKPGNASLKIKDGLPKYTTNIKPIWPFYTYEFDFSGELETGGYIEIHFYIGGIVAANKRSKIKIFEWDGKSYKDITTNVDILDGVISGKTNKLSKYAIFCPLEKRKLKK